MRRVYLPQYSVTPITNADNDRPWSMAVPFLENGEVVYDRASDTAENYGGVEGINYARS